MKRSHLLAVIVSAALSAYAASAQEPSPRPMASIDPSTIRTELHVARDGNDAWSGRLATAQDKDGPFATPERARDEVRKMKARGALPPGGVAINIHAGTYTLSRSLELDAQDSGTAQSPVVYQAYHNEEVHLIGGRDLSSKDFQPVTDPAILTRLDSTARGHVVQANLAALGIQHIGPFPKVFSDGGGIFELFFNGQRMPLSRWPNDGYVTMKRVLVNGDPKTPGVFEYREDRAARWSLADGLWLKGKWRVGWEDPAIQVASIDQGKRQITFAAGIPAGIGSKYQRPAGSGKETYCAINLLEEIDRPGEWAINFASKMLYFWPPTPLETARILVSQLDKPIIALRQASHIGLIGLTIEGSLGDGVVISKGSANFIAGCTIRDLAGKGVVIDGSDNGVQSCDLYGLGEGCIYISGGDRLKLTPANNYAVNNHLHHYAVLKNQYSPAIQMGFRDTTAVGNYIAHNLIHHAPRDAVVFGGNDNLFEYNEIHTCAYDTADTGAFYAWLDWTIRGVVIRYNYIHDTVGGVNPDDGSTGTTVYGNIFRGDRIGVWIASGPDHTIRHNVFIKDRGPVFGMDDRGTARGYATHPGLHKRVQEINPTQPPWSVRYPEMVKLLDEHPELPLRTVFSGNVIVMQSGEPYQLKMNKKYINDPSILRLDNNFITATDPGFVDAAHGNYALKSDSLVFKKIPGFEPIPFDKIGLQVDRYRPRLPTPVEAGHVPDPQLQKRLGSDRNFGT